MSGRETPEGPALPGLSGWLSIRAAAKALGIHWRTMYRIVQRNQPPTVRIGRLRLVRLSDLRPLVKQYYEASRR